MSDQLSGWEGGFSTPATLPRWGPRLAPALSSDKIGSRRPLVWTAGVNDSPGLALKFRGPRLRRLVALLIARGAEHPGDQAVAFLRFQEPLKACSQELPARFADTGVTNARGGRGAASATHLDRILALPRVEPRFLLAGAVVAKGPAHVAHVVHGLARLARPSAAGILLRIKAGKLLVIGLGSP